MFRFSLKTRLAASYALLFFISCLGIMALCSYLVYRLLNKAYDADAERMARRTLAIHLLGRRADSFNEIRPGNEYPEEDLEILEEKFPSVKVLFCGFRYGFSDRYHTAFVLHNNEHYEMRVLADGKIFQKKIVPEQNKSALKKYFSALVLNRGQENFSIAVFDRNASVYLESPPGAIKPFIREKLIRKPCRKENINKFRYFLFDLGGGRHLVIGMSLRQRLAWLADITFLGMVVLGCMTVAGSFIAWLLTRRFIRGVKETTLAMTRISSGDYSYRLRESSDHDHEIRELTATFNAMNERTENLLKELRTVSDNVAHDLRTPLTRISGTVELLLTRKDLPEEIRNDCASVAEEIARLKALVNTIMDIARTNAAPGTLQMQKMGLCAVCRDFCEFMMVSFEERSLEFRTLIPDDEIYVYADKNMFQRVLSNLLGNALKFTEKGFVSLRIVPEKDRILLTVEDSGSGIAPEEQDLVFKRFFRSDASRHLQGNGLGLSLVKAIVKAHQWQIKLVSTPGKGSAFTLVIPRQSTAPL